MSSAHVLRLLRISRTVSDLARAVAFYRDTLDFRVVDEVTHNDDAWGRLMGIAGARAQSVTMRLGEQEIELVMFDPPGDPYPSESSATDLWFQHIAIVVSDIQAAYTRLYAYSFKPISENGPQQLPPTSGNVIAFKFRDPDGHPLELIQFPEGTGNARWRQKTGLFCGIDHSAIDVADVERSIDFYTRMLGLRVVSRSVNTGTEQARLDHEPNVQVDVVALQPSIEGPPHLELLGYVQPEGCPIPADFKSSDVIADRLILQVQDLPRLLKSMENEQVTIISSSIAISCGGQFAVHVRDPAGHSLVLVTTSL
ncbi:VOC family protein [Thiobacillus sp.]